MLTVKIGGTLKSGGAQRADVADVIRLCIYISPTVNMYYFQDTSEYVLFSGYMPVIGIFVPVWTEASIPSEHQCIPDTLIYTRPSISREV